jgi:methylaspartate ammonia-lyase
MILRRLPVFPHGLIDNAARFQKALEYVKWTRRRIRELVPDETYTPILHYDFYGNMGLAFENNMEKVIGYLHQLEETAKPFKLQVEDPFHMSSKAEQMEVMSELRRRIRKEGLAMKLVADEWVPTLEDKIDFIMAEAADIYQIKPPDLGGVDRSIEAVLYCKSKGVGAYLGGSSAETARSAEVSVHIALATRPDQVLAKPGMGVDEGVSIMYNEMQRTLALIFGERSP